MSPLDRAAAAFPTWLAQNALKLAGLVFLAGGLVTAQTQQAKSFATHAAVGDSLLAHEARIGKRLDVVEDRADSLARKVDVVVYLLCKQPANRDDSACAAGR